MRMTDLNLPTDKEMESKLVCSLIRFVLHQSNERIPVWVHRAADCEFGRPESLEPARQWLLELCKRAQTADILNLGCYDAERLKQWLTANKESYRKSQRAA